MNRKKSFIMVLVLIIVFVMLFSFKNIEKNKIEKNKSDFYEIIEQNVKEAVEYNISATNLNSNSLIHFDHLISNGYLDKEKLKDGSTYCDGYVLVKEADEKPCYKIYLKCNGYITEGYDKMDRSNIC